MAVQGFELDRSWQMPGSLDIALPCLGCLVGIWMGMSWLRGGRARVLILPKLAFLILLVFAVLVGLLFLGIEEAALPFEASQVTSDQKRELVALFRGGGQKEPGDDEIRSLTLSKGDIDALLAWGLSVGKGERKAMVSLDRGSARLHASAGFPIRGEERRYFNFRLGMQGSVDDGILTLQLEQLSLGRLRAPRWLLHVTSPLFQATVET